MSSTPCIHALQLPTLTLGLVTGLTTANGELASMMQRSGKCLEIGDCSFEHSIESSDHAAKEPNQPDREQ